MERIQTYVEEEIEEAIATLSKEWGISKSEVAADAISTYLAMHKQELPDYLKAEAINKYVRKQNKHKVREIHFRNNVRDTLDEWLDKPFPPDEEKLRYGYINSLHEQIDKEFCGEFDDELHAAVEQETERYLTLRMVEMEDPTTFGEEEYKEAVRYALTHVKSERWDLAVEYCERLAESGKLPDTMMAIDMVNDVKEANKETEKGEKSWEEEWEEKVGRMLGYEYSSVE